MSRERYLDITYTDQSLVSQEIKIMEEKARCPVEDVERMCSGAHSDSSPGFLVITTHGYTTRHLWKL